MIKRYCDICGKEIGVDSEKKINISIDGHPAYENFNKELCEECFGAIGYDICYITRYRRDLFKFAREARIEEIKQGDKN